MATSVTPKQIASALSPDALLVEVIRYPHQLDGNRIEERYGAILIAAAGDPLWVPLGPAIGFEELVTSYQKSVRGETDSTKLKSDLRALHDRFWLPIERVLPRPYRRVILSPDGALNFVSFATLLDSEGHFLAERYHLQYVANGRDLLREVALPRVTSPTATVFANPDLTRVESLGLAKDEYAAGAVKDLNFDPLPGTQQECDRLREAFDGWHWRTETFTGPQATEAALRQVHSPYVLHLATHGFFEPAAPSDTQPLEQAP